MHRGQLRVSHALYLERCKRTVISNGVMCSTGIIYTCPAVYATAGSSTSGMPLWLTNSLSQEICFQVATLIEKRSTHSQPFDVLEL
jgi:hypothetical protein